MSSELTIPQTKIDPSGEKKTPGALLNTRHSTKPGRQSVGTAKDGGNRYSLVKECYIDRDNVNNVVFQISELPIDFQNAARKFDLDDSGTIDRQELASAL